MMLAIQQPWIKRLEEKCKEASRQHGSLRRIHMNPYAYRKELPNDVWRPYRGSTDAGEMIVNDSPVEIILDEALKDNQLILEF